MPYLTTLQPEPMFNEMFESFKKHLPKGIRKEIESRHAEMQRIQAEYEKEQEIKLSEILDSETLMRFAYVPFVIATLAWDYVDTVLTISKMLNIKNVIPISRSIRQLKRDYDVLRAKYIDSAHSKSEENNMYVFEDGVNDVFKLYLVNIELDIKREYPDLSVDYILYLKAIYQCHIVLKSLYKYIEIQTKNVQKIVGHTIGDILPQELRKLDSLVMAFIGDKSISKDFEKQQNTYATTLANRMCSIELSETKDELT